MSTALCIQEPMLEANAPKKTVLNVRLRSTSAAVPTTIGRSPPTSASSLSSSPTCWCVVDIGDGSISRLSTCHADGVTDPESAVRTAYLPALLVALAHSLGDLSLLRDDLRPDPARVQEPAAGLSAEKRQAARELAVEGIRLLADRPVADP